MRTLLAAVLVAVGLAAVLVVQTMGYAGRDLVDADRFAAATVEALSGPDGRDVVADTLTSAVVAAAAENGVPVPERVRIAIRASASAAVARPAFAAAVRPVVADGHRRLLDDPGAGVAIPLGPLRGDVVAALQPYGAAVVRLVPPAEGFPTLRVPLPEGSEGVLRVARALRDGWPLAILVALLALGAGIAVANVPADAMRVVGVAILVLAAVPVVVRLATPAAVEAAASERVQPLAEDLALVVTDGWLQAAAWTAAAGLALVVAGGMWGGRRGVARRG